MTDSIIVNIEKLIYGGDGLARLPDGRAVFVPFVLPGEEVSLNIIEEKPRFARALPLEIIKPSPMRITPLCKHFGTCGGCHYQHIPYQDQIIFKREILLDQLKRIGNINDPPLLNIFPSPETWHYRNHMQFHSNHDGQLGFVDITGQVVFPIQECHLPQNLISDTWPKISLDANSGINKASLRQDSFDEVLLLFEGDEETPPEMDLDLPISAAYLNPSGFSYTIAGNDTLAYKIKEKIMQVSAESFFQVNTKQAKNMVDFVLDSISKAGAKEILELYSGVGLFSIFLAEFADHLTAVESAISSCYDFAANLDAFDNVSLYEATVDEALPGLLIKPDLILLDPPRAGLTKQARDLILQMQSPQVLYISCDPATLARDLKQFLSAGYRLESIAAFDMFPQTYHVETMTVLRRTQRVTS